jgi:sirohydrochlorin cobaltochelatase
MTSTAVWDDGQVTSGGAPADSVAVVLAMHGLPARDFPREALAELMAMQSRLGHGRAASSPGFARRYRELDRRVRAWPRTEANDPFFAGSTQLATQLSAETGWPVVVGFNEFCAPDLDEALDQAASLAAHVYVVTPMMTRGGEHSEVDIPAAIERARQRHPDVRFVYAWPYPVEKIARHLAEQLARFPSLAGETTDRA